MGVRKLSAFSGLKRKLIELARTADSYEEVKLTLALDGWDLDDVKAKEAVKRWLYGSFGAGRYSETFKDVGLFKDVIAIWEPVDASKIAARAEVLKRLWLDVIGRKDAGAARRGLMLAANVLDSSWRKLDEADAPAIGAIAELVAWFGELACGRKDS